MQFLNQAIDFQVLDHHAAPTWTARVDADSLLAFGQAARQAQRRLVALWGSDERDRRAPEGGGFALHVAIDLAEGLVCLTLPMDAAEPVRGFKLGVVGPAASGRR